METKRTNLKGKEWLKNGTKKRKQTKMQMHKWKADAERNHHSQIAYQFHLENLFKS